MIRVLTGLTALMLTGLIAATTIGLALAGRNDDHREPQQSVEATQKADVGPIHVRVVDDEGAIAPGAAVDVHTWSQPSHSFPTDAQGRGVIPAMRSVTEPSSSPVATGNPSPGRLWVTVGRTGRPVRRRIRSS